MPRLTRAQRKQITTAQLLETARDVFLRRGYHRSSLDDIADAAGFTTGVVYARFQSKDELFFALYDRWIEQRIAQVMQDAAQPATLEDWLRTDARRIMALSEEHADWYILLLEFWTYAARDPKLREQFAAHHNRLVGALAAAMEAAASTLGVRLAQPASQIARAGVAMALGVILERMLDPAAVPQTDLESMLVLLANHVARPQKV